MAVGLGSLTNTLSGLDPRTLAQALAEEEQRRLAEQTALAAGQAQQAGAAYQGAAQAPPPELGLAEQFIPALLGNIASVIGQNPQYAQQGQERIQQSRATLLKARAENLQSLRDVWAQKAEMAQKAGDLEMEATARQKQEQIAKTYDLVKLNAEHAFRTEEREKDRQGAMALEGERGKQDRLTVGARGAQDRATNAAAGSKADRDNRKAMVAQGLDPDAPEGEERLLTPWALREIGRRNQLAKRGDSKSRDQMVTEIRDIHYRKWSSDKTPLDMGQRLLKARSPLYGPSAKEQRYLLTDEKVYRKVRGQWVKDAETERRAKQAANDLVEPYFPS